MRSSGISGMIVGAFLVAVGAILAWAVTYQADGIDLNQVGVILLVTGLVVALVSFVLALTGPSRTVRTVRTEPRTVVRVRPVARTRQDVIVEE